MPNNLIPPGTAEAVGRLICNLPTQWVPPLTAWEVIADPSKGTAVDV